MPTLLVRIAPTNAALQAQDRAIALATSIGGKGSLLDEMFMRLTALSQRQVGDYAAAESSFRQAETINARFPDETLVRRQPLLYQGALIALALGDLTQARQRGATAQALGVDVCGAQSHCVRAAEALNLWLARTPAHSAKLALLAEQQWQQDDGEAWRSQMWLAEAAVDTGDIAQAKMRLERIRTWLAARGGAPEASLIRLCRRIGVTAPETPKYDLDILLAPVNRQLEGGARIQAQKAALAQHH